MSVKLSICIVTYNNYEDVKKAIKSIEKYTTKEITKKIFIVDNGTAVSSINETNDFKEFIKKYSDIEYIDVCCNLGFGKGHNFILNKIDSQYHAIVNPDILFCEDSFLKIINWMDKNLNVGMTIPLIIDEKGNRQKVYRLELTLFDLFNRTFLKEFFKKRAKKHSMDYMDYTKPFEVPFGQGSFLVIRTNLFKKINGFDDNFFMYVEDADLCKRVNQVSKLMFFPDTKVIHRWEKGSHKSLKLFKFHVQSIIYYFKKWGLKIL